ncbi:hypothetical protein GEMRC1_007044 [Eukaryota sp. GEM-RC1]
MSNFQGAQFPAYVLELLASLRSSSYHVDQMVDFPAEDLFLEYKSYLNFDPRKICDDFVRYTVAFLNGSGGVLIGGVNENTHERTDSICLSGMPLPPGQKDLLKNKMFLLLGEISPVRLVLDRDILVEFVPLSPNQTPADSDSDDEYHSLFLFSLRNGVTGRPTQTSQLLCLPSQHHL